MNYISLFQFFYLEFERKLDEFTELEMKINGVKTRTARGKTLNSII